MHWAIPTKPCCQIRNQILAPVYFYRSNTGEENEISSAASHVSKKNQEVPSASPRASSTMASNPPEENLSFIIILHLPEKQQPPNNKR